MGRGRGRPSDAEYPVVSGYHVDSGESVGWSDGELSGSPNLILLVRRAAVLGIAISIPGSGSVEASLDTAVGAAAAILSAHPGRMMVTPLPWENEDQVLTLDGFSGQFHLGANSTAYCRSQLDGGRRCRKPAHTRRRKDRANYAAAQASSDAGTYTNLTGRPASRVPDEVPSMEEVRELIRQARAVLDKPSKSLRKSEGLLRVTRHGWEAEEAVSTVGAALTSIIDEDVRVNRMHQLERQINREGNPLPMDKGERDRIIAESFAKAEDVRKECWEVERVAFALEEEVFEGEQQGRTDEEHLEKSRKLDELMEQYHANARWLSDVMDRSRQLQSYSERIDTGIKALHLAATMKVLQGFREFGLGLGDLELDREHSDTESRYALESAVRFFPRDWIDSHNSCERPLLVRNTWVRGLYCHEATFTPDGKAGEEDELVSYEVSAMMASGIQEHVAVHEFAHRVEWTHIPKVGASITDLEEVWLQRRTGAANPSNPNSRRERLRPYNPTVSVEENPEQIRPDSFIDVYVGKEYKGSNAREVMSTGMEAIFGYQFGGLIGAGEYQADSDHRGFVLGVLALM